MSRARLSLARTKSRDQRPPLSLVKKAIRLYRGRGVPKATYRANAMKWIAATQRLGQGHILRGAPASWGRPGEPIVDQVHAPRRMRGST